ncbi:MAG TPA: cation-transporting P-type ATPase, partial [Pseudomonadales bacterium]|nr:cation-transporting P-type ATPase [Pseudomonadales bacterium]
MNNQAPDAYWSRPPEELFELLHSTSTGLSQEEAHKRLVEFGPNRLSDSAVLMPLRLLLAQFSNPLVLILLFAALVSSYLREWLDAIIV